MTAKWLSQTPSPATYLSYPNKPKPVGRPIIVASYAEEDCVTSPKSVCVGGSSRDNTMTIPSFVDRLLQPPNCSKAKILY